MLWNKQSTCGWRVIDGVISREIVKGHIIFTEIWMRPRHTIFQKKKISENKYQVQSSPHTDVILTCPRKRQMPMWQEGSEPEGALRDIWLVAIYRVVYAGRGVGSSAERQNICFSSIISASSDNTLPSCCWRILITLEEYKQSEEKTWECKKWRMYWKVLWIQNGSM